jgi:hypothetical protein
VAVLKTVITQSATDPCLSQALDYLDSSAPPIKFLLLLRLKIIV